MKKVRLHPEALRVESFAVAREDAEAGTVHAHATRAELTCDPLCEMTSLPSCPDTNCGMLLSEECAPFTGACE